MDLSVLHKSHPINLTLKTRSVLDFIVGQDIES